MAKSYLSLLALFALASFAEAQLPNIDVVGWVLPYQGTKEFEAQVGQTITFQWEGGHNVFNYPSLSCDQTGNSLVGATSGSQYTFLASDSSPEGTEMFFACNIGDGNHCRRGQSIMVTVYDDLEAIPEVIVVSPTDAPVPVANPTDAPVSKPATNAYGSSSGGNNANTIASMVGLLGAILALALV